MHLHRGFGDIDIVGDLFAKIDVALAPYLLLAARTTHLLEGVLRFGQAHSLGDLWHALGRVQEGERGLPPDLHDTIRWFCQVTGLA